MSVCILFISAELIQERENPFERPVVELVLELDGVFLVDGVGAGDEVCHGPYGEDYA